MPERPSEEEKAIYVKNQRAFRVRLGDPVTIFRKAESYENGWDCDWVPEMNGVVGRTGRVISVAEREAAGILIKIPGVYRYDGRYDGYFYPYTCLNIIR